MTERGTVLASRSCWSVRRPRSIAGLRVVTAMVSSCAWMSLFVGCVVPPSVLEPEPEGAPLLWIDTKDVDPPLVGDLTLIGNESTREFRVRSVQTTPTVKQPLRYYWYFDLDLRDEVVPVATYTLCPSSAVCITNVCAKINDSDRHTVLLVVSDQPLRDAAATDPFDFPEGTAYDWVQWGVYSKVVCP